jgi:hypothetical protein
MMIKNIQNAELEELMQVVVAVDPYHHYCLIQQKILLMVVIKLLKNSLTKTPLSQKSD